MRFSFPLLIPLLLWGAPLMAQGNPRDFERAGPAAERQAYYAQVRSELNEVLVRWQRAWENDDAAAVAAIYEEEASYFPPIASAVEMRGPIRDYFKRFLGRAGHVHVQMLDFGMSGDLAYLTSRVTYEILGEASPRSAVSTDVLVLRRTGNGVWRIQTHMARPEPDAKALP